MKDVIGYFLPLLWNYLENFVLMLRNPYKVFSTRMTDPIYFKDSILFLLVSSLISALLATILFSRGGFDFTQILLGSLNYSFLVLICSAGIFVCWWMFGYRDKSAAIIMPFAYAGGCGLLVSTALAMIAIGFLATFSPHFAAALTDVGRMCSSAGVIGSFQNGVDAGNSVAGDRVGMLISGVYLISTFFFQVSIIVGAYRTALTKYRLNSEMANTFLILSSFIFVLICIFISEAVSTSLSLADKDCVR